MAPPFMNASGLIPKILDKIIEASQPERFTQDFLGTKLGYASGSARPFIPLMKRLGFLASDGTPTRLYSRFRNPEERGRAMAEAIRTGYNEVFERNEYAHELPREKFKNLIVELTGLSSNDGTVSGIVSTFFNLKNYAIFDGIAPTVTKLAPVIGLDETPSQTTDHSPNSTTTEKLGFNLSYTINLNLPETKDVEVFNAIFKSLKENLLKV